MISDWKGCFEVVLQLSVFVCVSGCVSLCLSLCVCLRVFRGGTSTRGTSYNVVWDILCYPFGIL